MLLDSQNMFSDSQNITSGTLDSTNIIKFGTGDVSFAPLLVQVVNDFSNLTDLTLQIITSSDEDFTRPVVLAESTLELSDLTAGAQFPICHLPKGNLGYMKLSYTVSGEAETTGAITAGITAGSEISYHDIDM